MNADAAARRLRDVVVSGLALGALAPALVGTAFCITATTGDPPLYCQQRLGRGGRTFLVWKFRTMRGEERAPEDGWTRPDDPRITPVGRLLRRTGIDELPQLYNVLRGDMSLVGPRPTVPEQGPSFGPAQEHRLRVRPGLTGWSQIRGNAALGWSERGRLDRWYVEHQGFWLDLVILGATPLAVLRGTDRPC